YWLVLICLWFFFLYNIERLGEPINIASFVYVYAIICAVTVILMRPLWRTPLYWSVTMAMPPFFILKILLNYEIGGSNLPITVTEICAIGLSIILAGQMTRRLEELQDAVTSLTLGHLKQDTQPFEDGQGQIYREVRRARQYKRPVALLSVVPTEETKQMQLNRFIEEAQREILDAYVSARVASLLVEQLKDYDVITQRDRHFIVLLPETDREKVAEIVERLKRTAREQLGLEFKIGLSTFPDEAVTFERLLEQAEAKMDQTTSVAERHLELAAASVNGVAH
ncbi:MAG: hypothetical protein KC449_27695, partial [Anaerolineales bacterium]|nr:hypothetical protein [Anaerolineales bacterium]